MKGIVEDDRKEENVQQKKTLKKNLSGVHPLYHQAKANGDTIMKPGCYLRNPVYLWLFLPRITQK